MEYLQASPRGAATALLAELFAAPSEDRARGAVRSAAFTLAEHQEEAVRRARRILRERGGVLIADGVGLGKTYVALALIEEELSRGGRVLVAVPAALRSAWARPLQRLGHTSGCLRVTTHTRLSRGTGPAPDSAGFSLAVVDEAHRFRNPRTRRYHALAALCASARAVLITATPINNRLDDLHHLLRLFTDDDAFHDLGVASLAATFTAAAAQKGAGGGNMAEIRRIARSVMIRRTRAALRNGAAPLSFPRRAAPEIVRYRDDHPRALVRAITRLELAAHEIGPSPRGGGSALVRLGLLKRLDSSVAAFGRSLEPHIRFAHAFLDAADAGRLLRPGDVRGGSGDRDGDPHQLVLLGLVAEEAPPWVDLGSLQDAVRRDLRRLLAMRGILPAAADDPKLEALTTLCRRLAPERVVVFTEYRDTAEALWRALGRSLRVGRVDGSGAWLGRRSAGRDAVIERFAPVASGRSPPPPRERVDVLIATEVLAEGLNLQDARHVISYDLPWNPVRLLQRIGRVDRLGSPHDVVCTHLFVPARGVEQALRLRRTLRSKLGGMIDAVGSEADDRILARLIGGGPDASAALRDLERDAADVMDGLRQLWERERPHAPPGLPARNAPHPEPDLPSVALLPRRGPGVVLVEHDGRKRLLEWDPGTETLREPGPAVVGVVDCALEGGIDDDRRAASAAPVASLDAAVLRYFARLRASAAAPVIAPAWSPNTRLARRLRRAVRDTPAAPAVLLARADRLLARLNRPLPAATIAAAQRLLRGRDGGVPLAHLIAQLESILCHGAAAGTPSRPRRGPAPNSPRTAPTPRILIALLPLPIRAARPVDGPRARG